MLMLNNLIKRKSLREQFQNNIEKGKKFKKFKLFLREAAKDVAQFKKNEKLLYQYHEKINGEENEILNFLSIYPSFAASKIVNNQGFNKENINVYILEKLLDRIETWHCSNLYQKEEFNIQGLFYNIAPFIPEKMYQKYNFDDLFDIIYQQRNTNIKIKDSPEEINNNPFLLSQLDYIHNYFYRLALSNTINQHLNKIDKFKNTPKKHKIFNKKSSSYYTKDIFPEVENFEKHLLDLSLDSLSDQIDYFILHNNLEQYIDSLHIEQDEDKMLSYYEEIGETSFSRFCAQPKENISLSILEKKLDDFSDFINLGEHFVKKEYNFLSEITDFDIFKKENALSLTQVDTISELNIHFIKNGKKISQPFRISYKSPEGRTEQLISTEYQSLKDKFILKNKTNLENKEKSKPPVL